jgi:hypothetical protein
VPEQRGGDALRNGKLSGRLFRAYEGGLHAVDGEMLHELVDVG